MLHLLSWNVRYFSQSAQGLTSTSRTIEGVASAIASLNPAPDVIALQEVDHHSIRSHMGRFRRPPELAGQMDHFMAALNYHVALRGGTTPYRALFYRAHGHDRRLPLLSTGLAILYREDLNLVAHNAEEPWFITHHRLPRMQKLKQQRICAHARFELAPGETFDVFNTHLSLPAFLQRHVGHTAGRFGEADNQVEEVRKLLECAREFGDVDRGILVGDFNARPGSRVHRFVCEQSPFRDAFSLHLGLTDEQAAAIPSASFLHLRFRLDHVFTGPGVHVDAFPLADRWDAAHPMRGLSDHAPIMGQFQLERRASQ